MRSRLTAIWPRMYVRKHDNKTDQDLPGQDFASQSVANDLNARTELYTRHYAELAALAEIYRAYVAAAALAPRHPAMQLRTRTANAAG